MEPRRNVIALACGIVFGLGLGVAGVTDPARVIGFLDVTGDWNPDLAFVVISALPIYAIIYRLARGRGQALTGAPLSFPTRRDIDARLVTGAAIYGVGWGLSGLCPGPALTALATGAPFSVLFAAAMAAGMYTKDGLDRVIERGAPVTTGQAS